MRLLQPLKWYGAGPKSAVRLLNQVTRQCDAEKTSQASLRRQKVFRRNIEFTCKTDGGIKKTTPARAAAASRTGAIIGEPQSPTSIIMPVIATLPRSNIPALVSAYAIYQSKTETSLLPAFSLIIIYFENY